MTNPIIEQDNPGNDPDLEPGVPIEDYIWVLVLVGWFMPYLN